LFAFSQMITVIYAIKFTKVNTLLDLVITGNQSLHSFSSSSMN